MTKFLITTLALAFAASLSAQAGEPASAEAKAGVAKAGVGLLRLRLLRTCPEKLDRFEVEDFASCGLGELPSGRELTRGNVPQRAVRPVLVVVSLPLQGLALRVSHREEQLDVEMRHRTTLGTRRNRRARAALASPRVLVSPRPVCVTQRRETQARITRTSVGLATGASVKWWNITSALRPPGVLKGARP